MTDEVTIRREHTVDALAVRVVNEAAFGQSDEADLIDRLRHEGAILGSFVAEQNGEVVGHIVFSRILIESEHESVPAVALAPLAVVPAHQRKGIGGRLIRHGLDWLRSRGERVVLVLGDPNFYSRFGFSTERAKALTTPFPPAHFMALELEPDALNDISGPVRYAAAFQL